MINFDFQKTLSNLKGKIKTKPFNKGHIVLLYRDWMVLVFFILILILFAMIFSFYVFYETSSPIDSDGSANEVSEVFSRNQLVGVIKKIEYKRQKFEVLKINQPVAPDL